MNVILNKNTQCINYIDVTIFFFVIIELALSYADYSHNEGITFNVFYISNEKHDLNHYSILNNEIEGQILLIELLNYFINLCIDFCCNIFN